MWQPFTPRARRCIALAGQEAGRRPKAREIDVDDLLLGIIRDGESLAARVLKDKRGIGLAEAREIVHQAYLEETISDEDGAADNITTLRHDLERTQEIPPRPEGLVYSQQAKRCIEFAFEEARRSNHPYISATHLFLGILRMDASGRFHEITQICGDAADMRAEVEKQLQERQSAATTPPVHADISGAGSTWEPFRDDARHSIVRAQEIALERGDSSIASEHLLLAMVDLDTGVAAATLAAAGITKETLNTAVDRVLGKRRAASATASEMSFSANVKRVIEQAFGTARTLNQSYIDSGHLLVGLLADQETVQRILSELNLDEEKIRADTVARLRQSD